MLTLVGIIVLAISIILWGLPKVVEMPWEGIKLRFALIGVVVGLVLMLISGSYYNAKNGYGYLVQYWWGTQVVDLTPGIHFKGWGTAEPFKKVLTVKNSEMRDGDASGSYPPIDARFNDTVSATISLVGRYMMPTDKEHFKKLAVDYRSQQNLVSSTIAPYQQEVVRNSARRLSAQEFVGGKGGMFEADVLDQLQNGLYALSVTDKTGTGAAKEINTDDQRSVEEGQYIRTIVEPIYNTDGSIKRKDNPLSPYGIICTQAVVEGVDPEKDFKDRLKTIKGAAAKAQEEKQLAIAAEQAKRRVIAEGETTKAQKRVIEEEKQIIALTQAETSKKKAAIALEEERLKLQQAEIAAKNVKVTADAAAYDKAKMVEAGATPQERLAALVQMNKDSTYALANRAVPTNYFATSGGGGESGSGYDEEMVRQLRLMNLNQIKTLGVDTSIK